MFFSPVGAVLMRWCLGPGFFYTLSWLSWPETLTQSVHRVILLLIIFDEGQIDGLLLWWFFHLFKWPLACWSPVAEPQDLESLLVVTNASYFFNFTSDSSKICLLTQSSPAGLWTVLFTSWLPSYSDIFQQLHTHEYTCLNMSRHRWTLVKLWKYLKD